MDYKTILLHLDRSARCKERVELAFALSRTFSAHLVGLYAPYAFGETGARILKVARSEREEDAAAARSEFRSAMARNGDVNSEWRESGDDALVVLRASSAYCDLVVAGQHDPDAAYEQSMGADFVEGLVLGVGRPVLLVPYAGRFQAVGANALVAWNASAESARALHDALPLLRRARAVRVLMFEAESRSSAERDLPGDDIGPYLARHGVKVAISREYAPDVDVGSQILSRAADLSADLIVMGAYGHSRVRELILGGATRTILESMTAPVLTAH